MDQKILQDCPQVLRDYLFYMETILGRSSRTVSAYYIDLRTFLRFMLMHRGLVAADVPFDEIKIAPVTVELLQSVTLSDVYEFLNFTLAERSNNAKTRAKKVSCIRSFFKYLTTKANVLETNPVLHLETPSVKKSLPKYLNLDESQALLAALDPQNPRDACILTLFLNCGMRLSELTGINLGDIKSDSIRLLGKGNKERIVYLNESCRKSIDNYLTIRPNDLAKGSDRNALFLSRNGRRMSPRRVEQIIAELLKKAGLDGQGYSVHKLRHTFATLMYQHGGVDVNILKEILGHANLATTEIYTHVSDKQIRDAMQKSPLDGIIPGKTGSGEEK